MAVPFDRKRLQLLRSRITMKALNSIKEKSSIAGT